MEGRGRSLTAVTVFSGWHPKGLLVAHLHEHKAAVNRIRVSDEHSIFATASNDGTVKVWDSQKMEGKTTTTRWRCRMLLFQLLLFQSFNACLRVCCLVVLFASAMLSLLLQVRADVFPYWWSCEDAHLLSGLALLSRGLRQWIHPAARCRSK